MQNEREKIFVQIASYRDSECFFTVENIFKTAKYPERIFVGICNQIDIEEDKEIAFANYSKKENVREIIVPVEQVKGGVWARAQAQSLWRDEEYVLQLDAHMRFLENWDEYLIETLKKCPSKNPILSSMVTGYSPPDNLELVREGYRCITNVKSVYKDIIANPINLAGGIYKNEGKKSGLVRSPFIIGNFIFGHNKFFKDVPLDPFIYFHGYEISFSARLWTFGYDIFQPEKNYVYHYWAKPMSKSAKYKSNKQQLQKFSIDRVNHLLKIKPCNDENVLTDLEKYGLGNVRSLESFWLFGGIDLINGKMKEHAKEGFFEESYKQAIEMNKLGNSENEKPTIFVQIASYRDPELIFTLKSLFETAKHPERVFVGICNQIDLDSDKDFIAEPYPYKNNVRELIVAAKESKGVCWARFEAQKFFNNEDYVLMIDSHMRFVKDWDELFF
jgi:hypothetical protein